MMMPSVLITEPIAPSAVESLIQKGFRVQFEYGEQNPSIRPEDIVAVINRLHPIDGAWMDKYPALKVIAYHGVGYDGIDINAARERSIAVVITPGQNALAVAEHAMALILALSKMLVASANGYRSRGFDSKYDFRYSELAGKTLGLIGLGTIGRMVAKMAHCGFGMRVIAYDPFLSEAPEGIELIGDRMQVFREADYISPHLNLTDDTRCSIGETEFRAMKPTAYILNLSRGAIIDEPALIRALQDNEIAGAGLDVTDPERCEIDSPLMNLENVILTPHVAGSSNEALERVAQMCIANIEAILSGQDAVGKRIV